MNECFRQQHWITAWSHGAGPQRWAVVQAVVQAIIRAIILVIILAIVRAIIRAFVRAFVHAIVRTHDSSNMTILFMLQCHVRRAYIRCFTIMQRLNAVACVSIYSMLNM